MTTSWQPIETHKFPWKPASLLIAAKYKDTDDIEVFMCRCSKGEYYPLSSIIALHEDGWVPYAWSPDLPPEVEHDND